MPMISRLSIDHHLRNYDFGKHRSDWAVVGKVLRFLELTLCTNIILYTRRTCCVLEADETNFCLSPSRKSHIPPVRHILNAKVHLEQSCLLLVRCQCTMYYDSYSQSHRRNKVSCCAKANILFRRQIHE